MSEFNKNKLEKILNYRGMYGFEFDLSKAVSFVAGFDAANEGLVMKGFREWFLNKFLDSCPEPFSWIVLVERELDEMGKDEKQKVDRFVEMVIDFLHDSQ